MPTTRSYHDLCGIARALDVIGERWALLVIRELLLGPQRYSELRRVLTNTSSNVIADRLRELEANGVIQRRKLPPPAGSWVYELTPWGRKLEPILLSLGQWGLEVPSPAGPTTVSPTSVLLLLRTRGRPDPSARPTLVNVQLDDQAWTVRSHDGQLDIQAGEAATADATIRTDAKTFIDLIATPSKLSGVIRARSATVEGDRSVLQRLLREVDTGTAPRPDARRAR